MLLLTRIHCLLQTFSGLIGNSILRATHSSHFMANSTAATIGAAGFLPVSFLVGGLLLFSRGLSIYVRRTPQDLDEENNSLPWYIFTISTLAIHSLSGAIGVMTLRHHRVDIGDIDVLHAIYAGALGGAILSLGMLIAPYLILMGVGILLSPLWLAMKLGLRWMHLRSTETQDRITQSGSYFATFGTCGDVPDIEEELGYDPGTTRGGFYVGLFCGKFSRFG